MTSVDSIAECGVSKWKFNQIGTAELYDPIKHSNSKYVFDCRIQPISCTLVPYIQDQPADGPQPECEYIGLHIGKCSRHSKYFNYHIQKWTCEKHCKAKIDSASRHEPKVVHPPPSPSVHQSPSPPVSIANTTNAVPDPILKVHDKVVCTKKDKEEQKVQNVDFMKQLYNINMQMKKPSHMRTSSSSTHLQNKLNAMITK